MKMKDVKIGLIYAAKISGKIQPVKIIADRGTAYDRSTIRGNRTYSLGYSGLNLATNREVNIRSAAKLRYEVVQRGNVWQKLGSVDLGVGPSLAGPTSLELESSLSVAARCPTNDPTEDVERYDEDFDGGKR